MTMLRPLGAVLAMLGCLGLPACGSEAEPPGGGSGSGGSGSGGSGSSAPSSSAPPATPSTSTSGDVPQVVLVSESAAGGETTEVAVPLPDEAAVAAFAAQLDGRLTREVTQAAADLRQPGGELYGQVVAIGCDVPPQASVEERGAEVVLVPLAVKSPPVECLVPVTTVALALVER